MTRPDDIDPAAAVSVGDFAACLRRLRARADSISFRALERWGRQHSKPLPRSTVLDALAGKRLPRKALVLAFVEACGVDPSADPRWLTAWNRLAQRQIEPPRPSATQQDTAYAHPGPQTPERPLGPQLTSDIRAAGLRRIGASYLSDLEWGTIFAGVRELDIFVAYGQTWRNLHARELSQLAARKAVRIRVFLADADDHATVSLLSGRFAITPAELRERIEATRRDYNALRRPGGAQIEIYYRPGDRLFSFYRLDEIAVVGFYSHTRTRAAAVPVFVCASPGDLYQFISDEMRAIEDQSRPV